MSDFDLKLSPAPVLAGITGVIHFLSAFIVLLLPSAHWAISAALLAVLVISHCQARRTIHNRKDWCLVGEQNGWKLLTAQGEFDVKCHCEFISSLLVVVQVRLPHRLFHRRLVFTPGSGSSESWRRLHIQAAAGKRESGVADDNILSGKINGHKDSIPSNF